MKNAAGMLTLAVAMLFLGGCAEQTVATNAASMPCTTKAQVLPWDMTWESIPICHGLLPHSYPRYYLPRPGDLDEQAQFAKYDGKRPTPLDAAGVQWQGERDIIRDMVAKRNAQKSLDDVEKEIESLKGNWERIALIEVLPSPGSLERINPPSTPGYVLLVQSDQKYRLYTNMQYTSSFQDEGRQRYLETTQPTHYIVLRKKAERFFEEMDSCKLPQVLVRVDRPSRDNETVLYYARKGKDGRIEKSWQGSTSLDRIPFVTISSPQRQEAVARLLSQAQPPRDKGDAVGVLIKPEQHMAFCRISDEYMRLGCLVLGLEMWASSSSHGDIEEAIVELKKLDAVDGAAVYASGQEGDFWKAAMKLLSWGTKADFERLLVDKKPIVRVMGMFCLTQMDWAGRGDMLRARIEARDMLLCFPGGCCGESLSEGQIAYRLIHGIGFFGGWGRGGAVLTPRELLDLNMELASRKKSTNSKEAQKFILEAVNVWLLKKPPESDQ